MGQLKKSLSIFGLGTCFFAGYNIYNGNEKFYYNVLLPTSHWLLSPENAHKISVIMGKYNLYPKFQNNEHSDLKLKVFGLQFNHPVGIAAGFDKQGEAVLGLLNAGFSHVEVGSVTPEPQPGNDQPRVFRLPLDEAVINRYGFNSDGHKVVRDRLHHMQWKDKGIVGVNLGVNKNSTDPTNDYVSGVNMFGDICDYLVINVSSPNTVGLRKLQKRDLLKQMLTKVVKARDSLAKKTPLLLKISPDETDEDVQDIVSVVLDCCIDGLIVSNTTLSRDNLKSPPSITAEKGGLSGKPLADKSTALIARIYSMTGGKIPIIGVGGISSGHDAWEKLMAGASLVQLYTSFVYYGPPIAKKVVNELNNELQKSEFRTLYKFQIEREKNYEV